VRGDVRGRRAFEAERAEAEQLVEERDQSGARQQRRDFVPVEQVRQLHARREQ